MWRRSPLRLSSATTRQPISIELPQARLQAAEKISVSPVRAGAMKCTSSTDTVTQVSALCRSATTSEMRSMVAMTMPPKTVPLLLMSFGNTR